MFKRIVYLTLALAVVFYALPRLHFFDGDMNAQLFSIVWILFGLIVIGAQLDRLLLIDEKRQDKLKRLKSYQLWEKEQLILRQHKKQYRSKSRYYK